jgi:hypothetical protein
MMKQSHVYQCNKNVCQRKDKISLHVNLNCGFSILSLYNSPSCVLAFSWYISVLCFPNILPQCVCIVSALELKCKINNDFLRNRWLYKKCISLTEYTLLGYKKFLKYFYEVKINEILRKCLMQCRPKHLHSNAVVWVCKWKESTYGIHLYISLLLQTTSLGSKQQQVYNLIDFINIIKIVNGSK